MQLLKSKLLRNEIQYWSLLAVLFLWGITASVFAVSKSEKIILVGIDDAGVRLITAQSDRLLKDELQKFVLNFLDLYFNYDEKSFNKRVGLAADFFTEELWNQRKSELFAINQRLQKSPLIQRAEVESIDLLEDGKIEVSLALSIKSRMTENKVKLKVFLSYQKRDRSEENPFSYVITEISEKTDL